MLSTSRSLFWFPVTNVIGALVIVRGRWEESVAVRGRGKGERKVNGFEKRISADVWECAGSMPGLPLSDVTCSVWLDQCKV